MTLDNLANILGQVSLTSIIAVGLTFVILTGEIDLSVAAVANAIGIVMAFLMMQIAAGISAMLVRGQIAYKFPVIIQVLGSGKYFGLRWLIVVAVLVLLIA